MRWWRGDLCNNLYCHSRRAVRSAVREGNPGDWAPEPSPLGSLPLALRARPGMTMVFWMRKRILVFRFLAELIDDRNEILTRHGFHDLRAAAQFLRINRIEIDLRRRKQARISADIDNAVHDLADGEALGRHRGGPARLGHCERRVRYVVGLHGFEARRRAHMKRGGGVGRGHCHDGKQRAGMAALDDLRGAQAVRFVARLLLGMELAGD